MTDYGIKVSKSGTTALSTNMSDLLFNSEKICLKTAVEASASYSITDGNTLVISHNLGYVPAFLTFFSVGSRGKWYPGGSWDDSATPTVHADPQASTANLYFNTRVSDASTQTINIYYYLFVEPGR